MSRYRFTNSQEGRIDLLHRQLDACAAKAWSCKNPMDCPDSLFRPVVGKPYLIRIGATTFHAARWEGLAWWTDAGIIEPNRVTAWAEIVPPKADF